MAPNPLLTSGIVSVGVTGRRRFTPEFKRQIVELTLQPGASVAGIALAHQVNANQLFKWRRQYLAEKEITSGGEAPTLLPVEITPALEPTSAKAGHESVPSGVGRIDIEVGTVRVRVTGAVDPATLRTVLASLRGR
jgi:transposase